MSQERPCPACGLAAFKPHCTSKTCDLLVCRGCRSMTTPDRKHCALSNLGAWS